MKNIPVIFSKSIGKWYALCLLGSSLLGADFFAIPFPYFHLTPYRLLLLLSPILLFLLHTNKEYKQAWKNYNYPYFVFLWIWLVYAILSGLWVKDYVLWGSGLLFFLAGCISSYFIVSTFNTRKDFFTAFRLVEGIALLIAFLGLWEICTARYFFVQETYAIRYTECALGSFVHRPLPVATFSNVNDLSSFLYFSFFIALALFFLRTKKAAKVLDVFCMLIYLVVIVAGQSRSVFLGFILALLALLIYWICKFIRQKKWKRIGIWTLVGVTVLGCCLFLTKETLLSSNFWLDDRSDTSRMNLMKDGFIYLYNHWFMGVGWGNIEYYRSQSMDPMSIDTITQIHNWWMEILVTSGIFIFAGYLWIYLRNYKHLFQASLVLKNRVEQKNMLVFFMAFTGCVIVFVASSSFVRCDWFWVILALLFAYCGHHPIPNENQKKLDL